MSTCRSLINILCYTGLMRRLATQFRNSPGSVTDSAYSVKIIISRLPWCLDTTKQGNLAPLLIQAQLSLRIPCLGQYPAMAVVRGGGRAQRAGLRQCASWGRAPGVGGGPRAHGAPRPRSAARVADGCRRDGPGERTGKSLGGQRSASESNGISEADGARCAGR
jgi:hypothetical protein